MTNEMFYVAAHIELHEFYDVVTRPPVDPPEEDCGEDTETKVVVYNGIPMCPAGLGRK